MTTQWRKSSFSGNGANCVEVGHADHTMLTRDTKNRDNGTLAFTRTAWKSFLTDVRAGKYDR